MNRGYAYNPQNPTHINLNFVGKISPSCENETCCSCALISENKILTAWHCLDKPCGDFCVQFPSGSKNRILSFQRIGDSDIAIGFLEKSETIKPIRIIDSLPEEKTFSILAGFGINENKFDLRMGFSIISYVHKDCGVFWCDDTNILSPVATSGDSGGVVICHDGFDIFLAGTITGTTNRSYSPSKHLDVLQEHVTSELYGIDQNSFIELCSIEVARRKMVENNFSVETSDDWIDIDRWLFERVKNKQFLE